MASRKFRFVSPGVFLKEIDNSQLPRTPEGVGPVIIGRTRKGPSMKPYKVRSLEEFERVFGKPMPGNQGEDPWRDGTGLLAESYLPYAARAYLSADIDSPATIIRLAGVAGDDAVAGGTGEPGWEATNAWGLFVGAKGAITGNQTLGTATLTGSMELAAIFYGTAGDGHFGIKTKGVACSGNVDASVNGQADIRAVHHTGTNFNDDGTLTVQLSSSSGTREVSFAFEDIRKDFNTNPVMTNTTISSVVPGTLAEDYWLGETFEENYRRVTSSVEPSRGLFAIAVQLTDGMDDFKSLQHGLTAARTGWVFGNDTSGNPLAYTADNQQKLFRIIATQEGFEASKDLMIGIEDIKPARAGALERFGTFSVVVKKITSSDVVQIERFDGLNLNPDSTNFIARRIGDTYMEWDPVQKRNKMYGSNLNVSEFIRVEMNSEIETQGGPINTETVPFGFFGAVVPKTFQDSRLANARVVTADTWTAAKSLGLQLSGAVYVTGGMNIKYPTVPLVATGSTEPGQSAGYMFGITPYKQTYSAGAGTPTREINKGYVDFVRIMSDLGTLIDDQLAGDVNALSTGSVPYKFTLDDVIVTPKSGTTHAALTGPGEVESVVYTSGSRAANLNDGTGSWTQHVDRSGSCDLRTFLDIVGGFNMPLAGGNDGVNIVDADPFNMGVIDSDSTTANSYAYASVDRAIEMIRDPELVEHNLAAMPGITNTTLTTKLVRTCESRGDSLAIIDLPDVYVPPFQAKCSTFKNRVDGTTPEASAKNLVARQLNSSYGATYYPWVKIKDETFNRDVWVPPSVVALGVMAYTEERDDVWFAPAGFNRGGLNTGNAGLPVLQASEQLLAKDRDTLYAANINPVAQFVSEGLVIFGQKTLQSTPSALDRINVRRLLIFVKKEVSRISNGLLFEQNVQATWSRFTNQVVPFLNRVKTRFGLSDFKVILDETTTTPDLIDRNIMYAKVLLKPARSIEFIAVDFVITNTGASFDD